MNKPDVETEGITIANDKATLIYMPNKKAVSDVT